VIGTAPERARYPDLWVSTEKFAQQLESLAARGYQGVTLADVHDSWHGGATLPEQPLIVSFDDGYAGLHALAQSVLAGLGWPAVLFLTVGSLGEPGALTIEMVGDLVAAGWEVNSHTMTHRDLTALRPDEVRHEMEASKAWLQQDLGVSARFFCYPFGSYNDEVAALVPATGYEASASTRFGLARPADRWALARIKVTADDSAHDVLRKLHFATLRDQLPPPNAASQGGARSVV
jgi:peptidoglycan/xylan/chitin deacetylase (PgdA/CDA1 family)